MSKGKWVIIGVSLFAFSSPAWAVRNDEDFSDPGYVVGRRASDFFFNTVDDGTIDIGTAGALTIAGTNGGERWVDLTVGTQMRRGVGDWGGLPSRAIGQTPLYWSFDILKGSGTATGEVFRLGSRRANGEYFFELAGDLTHVRGIPYGVNNVPINTDVPHELEEGWNRVCIINDPGVGGGAGLNEFKMLLNGTQVYQADLTGTWGLTPGGAISILRIWAQRTSNATGTGSMSFDNFLTANSEGPAIDCSKPIPEPATLALIGLAALGLQPRRRAAV